MSGSSWLSNDLQVVYTYEQLMNEIRDMPTEEQVIKFVQNHRLEFLHTGEVIKVRKKEKQNSIFREDKCDRSNHLLRSLIIFSNGMVFYTGKNGNKSTPGGKEGFVLGRGAFKRVYKVQDLNTKVFVAFAEALSASCVNSLKNEYELTQLINCPYVLQVQCYGIRKTHQGAVKAYVVSELCDDTLANIIEVCDFIYLRNHPEHLTQIRIALDECHAIGIVHNDIHPGNVFVKMNGEAILADFGKAYKSYYSNFRATNVLLSSLQWVWRVVTIAGDELAFDSLRRTYELANLSPNEELNRRAWNISNLIKFITDSVRAVLRNPENDHQLLHRE